jgi:DNA-directed RNA polymerase subunit RPC12/RpoP
MPDAPPPLPKPNAPPVTREPTLSKAPPPGRLFPCANCGAKVEFDPRSRTLTCPYCGHSTTVPDADGGEVVEHDFEEYLRKAETGGGTAVVAGRSAQVRCGGCGATVLLEDKVVTEKCPYCGTHLENKPEHAAAMIPPESLIPFGVDLRAARGAFVEWLMGLWFAPTGLKKVAILGQLAGVYVPYWTYDAMTYTRYRGMRGEDYQVEETYTERDAQGNTVTKTRMVTHTRWYNVSGEVQHFFDDVLVCGSKSVPPHLVQGLEPWKLGELEAFRPEFLSGFKTERYAVGLKEGFGEAKALMEPTIVHLIRQDIGGDHQRIEWKQTRYLGVTFKHLLLPVWVANYRYQERLFQILINGRTGKVSGERPWSWWKILRLVLLILAIVALIALLFAKAQGGGGGPASRGCEPPGWMNTSPDAGRVTGGFTPPARPITAAHASPDSFRITHSAVSTSATTASVHHDRRSGDDDSYSRTAARDTSSRARSPTVVTSYTRPPDAAASCSSSGKFAERSVVSSASGGSTSNADRSFPAGPRRYSAHSGTSGSAA